MDKILYRLDKMEQEMVFLDMGQKTMKPEFSIWKKKYSLIVRIPKITNKTQRKVLEYPYHGLLP